MTYPIAGSTGTSSSTFTVRDVYAPSINDPSLVANFPYTYDQPTISGIVPLPPHASSSTNLLSLSSATRTIQSSGNLSTHLNNTMAASNNFRNIIMDRLHECVSSEAQKIVIKFPKEKISENASSPKTSANIMLKMKKLAKQISLKNKDCGVEPLRELKRILLEHEISVFHFTHSGIDTALTNYLTDLSTEFLPFRTIRLQRFVDIFMSINVSL